MLLKHFCVDVAGIVLGPLILTVKNPNKDITQCEHLTPQ